MDAVRQTGQSLLLALCQILVEVHGWARVRVDEIAQGQVVVRHHYTNREWDLLRIDRETGAGVRLSYTDREILPNPQDLIQFALNGTVPAKAPGLVITQEKSCVSLTW